MKSLAIASAAAAVKLHQAELSQLKSLLAQTGDIPRHRFTFTLNQVKMRGRDRFGSLNELVQSYKEEVTAYVFVMLS